MSLKVKVVTAYVPLQVEHMSRADYHDLGQQMIDATQNRYVFWDGVPLENCWSYDMCKDKFPATETPPDRYASPQTHVMSHIVQHNRTQWAIEAAHVHPHVDVWVWLDLGILKQGRWNHKPILAEDVTWFLDYLEQQPPFDTIPFPGITGKDPWLPHGNNWRFCGSTHVWPTKYLDEIDRSYRNNLTMFVQEYGTVPLDLAIWPMVERNSGLPFKWYQAEYDVTQLRNIPCAL